MFRKTPRSSAPSVLAAVMLSAAICSAQDQTQGQPQKPGATALSAELVKTGLYLISGGGCNSLLRLSANGLIIVDGKLPGNYEALREQVKRISDQPIRILINTDYHANHTGDNAKFLAAGTQIIAQANVKDHLIGGHPPGGEVAPPTIAFDHDYTIRLGGIEAQLMHFGSAHTGGDTVVYFPNLKV